jgi:hypothetical protein
VARTIATVCRKETIFLREIPILEPANSPMGHLMGNWISSKDVAVQKANEFSER